MKAIKQSKTTSPRLLTDHTHGEPPRDDIARRAYFLWEQEGHPHNQQLDHWLRAEAELRERIAVTV